MEAVYTLRKDVIAGEDNRDTIAYGINIFDFSGELSEIVPGVFEDKAKAKEFITLCNSEKLETIHLRDALSDL